MDEFLLFVFFFFIYIETEHIHSLRTQFRLCNVYISSAGRNKSMYTVSTSLPLLLCSNIYFQKMFFGLKNIHAATACSDNVSAPSFVYLLKYS